MEGTVRYLKPSRGQLCGEGGGWPTFAVLAKVGTHEACFVICQLPQID